MPKDVYGHDTLAWALYKNGRYGSAAAAMTETHPNRTIVTKKKTGQETLPTRS